MFVIHYGTVIRDASKFYAAFFINLIHNIFPFGSVSLSSNATGKLCSKTIYRSQFYENVFLLLFYLAFGIALACHDTNFKVQYLNQLNNSFIIAFALVLV